MDLLTKTELERPRTPSELRLYIDSVAEKIGQDKQLINKHRLKDGLSREFIQELLPLSIYASWKYPDDNALFSLRIGNQPYDAIVTDLSNKFSHKVEITWPIDGKYENQQVKHLNKHGWSDLAVGDTQKTRAKAIDRVIEQAEKKALIDYDDASLLIVLKLWPGFFLDDKATQTDIENLIGRLQEINFLTGPVYLIPVPSSYVKESSFSPVILVKNRGNLKPG